MFHHDRVCAACGAHGTGSYCGACGRDYNFGAPSWQDGIYLGASAPLYRRGPREIRRASSVLWAPFRHFESIPHATWRFALFVVLVALTPLAANQFLAPESLVQYWVLGIYFSLVWAALFGALFQSSGVSWRLAVAAYFGTMIFGMMVLTGTLILNLEAVRDIFLQSTHAAVLIPASIIFIGIPEELTKSLVLFAMWRWGRLPALRAFIYYGILSGLGFGISEGIGYQTGSYYQAAESTKDFVGYFFESVLRLTSLPLLHAAWTGTTAYLLWFAAKVRSARTGLVLIAIGLPAIFHGVYDGLLAAKWGFAAMAFAAISLTLIAIYIASARQLEDAFEIPEDVVPVSPS